MADNTPKTSSGLEDFRSLDKTGERLKDASSARLRREDQRSPSHASFTQTTNSKLKSSFDLSEEKSGPTIRGHMSLGAPGSGGRITLSSKLSKTAAPKISPDGNQGVSPTPPTSGKPYNQRPAHMFVQPKTNNGGGQGSKVKPSQGSKVRPAPLKAVHNSSNVNPADHSWAPIGPPSPNTNSPQPPPPHGVTLQSHDTSHDQPRSFSAVPLGTARSHDSIPRSPVDSDYFPSGTLPNVGLGSNFPQQVEESSAGSKVITGDHASLVGDPETIRYKGLTNQLSTTSADSEASDKMIGPENSFRMGTAGAIGLLDASQKSQIEKLRAQLADRDEEIKVLQGLVDINVEKQVGENPIDSGDFPSEVGGEDQNMGGAKLLTNRSSLVTDEKGNRLPSPGRRKSKQEQELFVKCETLKAQNELKVTEIDSLFERNSRLEKTITSLQATINQNKAIYRRGFSNKDVDPYIDQVENLTKLMTEIEERERQLRMKNAELESRLSKFPQVTGLLKKVSTERDQYRTQVSQLASEIKEYRDRSALSDQTPSPQDSMDLRLVSLQANKVPDLQQEISSLKKQLQEARQEARDQTDEKLVEKITEMSIKDEEIRKLRADIEQLQQNAVPGSQDTDSEAYQILLQESAAKADQIEQLESALRNKQLDTEVKVQEVHSQLSHVSQAKAKTEADMREKMAEIQHLQKEKQSLSAKLEKTEKLNKTLRDHVANIAVPTEATSGRSHTNEVPLQTSSGRALSDSDSRKLVKTTKAVSDLEGKVKELNSVNETKDRRIAELEGILSAMGNERDLISDVAERDGRIVELESKVSALESGAGEKPSLQKSVEEVLSEKQSVVNHSKKQSKEILSLKSKMEETETKCAQLQNMVDNLKKERESSDFKLKRVSAEKIMLEERSKHRDFESSTAVQSAHVQRMEADLSRIRTERAQLRHELDIRQQEVEALRQEVVKLPQVQSDYDKLKEAFERSQQKVVAQQLAIDKKNGEIIEMRKKTKLLTDVAKTHQTNLEIVTSERDQLKSQQELMEQQTKMFEEDFQTERKDREAAHSKYADLERKYDHQTRQLANELQIRTRELEVATQVNNELKVNIENMEANLKEFSQALSTQGAQLVPLTEENEKLKEEVKSKTQQVKHYQRQTDQFRNQFEASAENSDFLKAQVESTSSRTDQLERENGKLAAENEKLSAKIRHLENTASSSVDQRKYEEKMDALMLKNGILQSEVDELKRGVVSHQAPPTRATDYNVSHRAQMQQQLLPSQGLRPLPSRSYLRHDGKSPSADDASLSSRGQQFGTHGNHNSGRPTSVAGSQTLGAPDQRRQSRTADISRGPMVRQDRVQPQNYNFPPSNSSSGPPPPGGYAVAQTRQPAQDYHSMDFSSSPLSLPSSIGSPQGQYGQRQEVGGDPRRGLQPQYRGHRPAEPKPTPDYVNYPPPYGASGHPGQAVPQVQLSPVSAEQHQLSASGGYPYRGQGQLSQAGPPPRHHSSIIGQPREEMAPPRSPLAAGTRHTSYTTQPPSNQPHTDQTSASSGYIQLDKNIDNEIHLEAEKMRRQGSGDISLPVEDDSIPVDPNLVCPSCKRQFRIGEIQKFKRHAGSCVPTS